MLDPQDYVLLGYTIDPRTGLGGFNEYFMQLLQDLKKKTIDEIMKLPEVTRRVDLMRKDWLEFKRITQGRFQTGKNVVITDFRGLERIPAGNRFLVYTLFPAVNVSLRVHWGPQKKWVSAVVGHSIFNRTCRVNVGELMSDFGGGGHFGAGATPLKLETADADIAEIVRRLQYITGPDWTPAPIGMIIKVEIRRQTMLKLKVLLPILLLIFISILQAQTASDQTQTPAAQPSATTAPAGTADFDHAMRQYRRGHYSEAIAEFNQVVAADPNNAAAWYFMGYAQYVTHHLPDSLAFFSQAFNVNPEF